jgi:hypothetical protein
MNTQELLNSLTDEQIELLLRAYCEREVTRLRVLPHAKQTSCFFTFTFHSANNGRWSSYGVKSYDQLKMEGDILSKNVTAMTVAHTMQLSNTLRLIEGTTEEEHNG